MIQISDNLIYDPDTGISYRRGDSFPAGYTRKEAEEKGEIYPIVSVNSVHSASELDGLRLEREEALSFWASLCAPLVAKIPATLPATVTFEHALVNNKDVYTCDQPGDMSGSYIPASKVAALVDAANAMLSIRGITEGIMGRGYCDSLRTALASLDADQPAAAQVDREIDAFVAARKGAK